MDPHAHPVPQPDARLQATEQPPATVHVVDYATPTAAPECVGDCPGCEEEQDRKETEQAHAAGNHEWCGLDCEVTLTSEQLRNAILCQAIPGSPAMLAELERRAAASVVPPPFTEAELAAGAADVAFLNAEFPDEPQDLTGAPAVPLLSAAERTFLALALDLAGDHMASRSNEFDGEDAASLAALRKLAGGEQA